MRLPIGLLPAILLAFALGVWAAVDVSPVVRARPESKPASEMRAVARRLSGVVAEVGAIVEDFGDREIDAARVEAARIGVAPTEMEKHILDLPRVGSILRLRYLYTTVQAGSGFLIREIEAAARDVDGADTPEAEQATWLAFAEQVRPSFKDLKQFLIEIRSELRDLSAPACPSVDGLLLILESVGL